MKSPPRTLLNIQALRAIAALLVVFRHIGDPKIGIEVQFLPHDRALIDLLLGNFAGVGVDIFFVISGFIMIVTSWDSFGKRGAGLDFLARRVIRIYPAYWLALVPVLIGILLTQGHLLRARAGADNILADLLLVPQAHPTLGISWTLSYEIYFYLVFAAILLLPRNVMPVALIVWTAITIILSLTVHNSADVASMFIRSLIPLQFIAGMLIGLCFIHKRMPFARATTLSAILANVLLWAAFKHSSDGSIGIANELRSRIALLIPSALLVYSLVSLELTRNKIAPRWLSSLGDSSYALYLWHISILFALGRLVARLHPHGILIHILVVVAMTVITIFVSMGIYMFFEKPLTRRLNRAWSTSVHAHMPAERSASALQTTASVLCDCQVRSRSECRARCIMPVKRR